MTAAKAALEALTEEATEKEKADAEAAVAAAEATAATAATAKTAADTKAAEADEARDDARVAAARAYGVFGKAVDDALAAKIAADAALAQAKKEAEEEEEGEDCEPEQGLTAEVTGLPTKLVAGTTTAFSIRVTNGSDRQMDEIVAYTGVHATDKSGLNDTGKFFRLQWSSESSPKWKNVEHDYIDAVGALKPGARTDLKMRLTLDKATPAGNGVAFIAADFYNEDGSCGGTPGADMYEFDVKAMRQQARQGRGRQAQAQALHDHGVRRQRLRPPAAGLDVGHPGEQRQPRRHGFVLRHHLDRPRGRRGRAARRGGGVRRPSPEDRFRRLTVTHRR